MVSVSTEAPRGRVLPHSQEAEESVIGGILLHPRTFNTVDEFLDAAEHEIFEVAQRSQKTSFEPIKKILKETISALGRRYERKQAITGVPTAYHKFDDMTAGLQPGDLVIIAARPSMGKTSF